MTKKLSKAHMMISGLIVLVIGLLALVDVMNWYTILGNNGWAWLYVLVIFMGLKKLMHPMCK